MADEDDASKTEDPTSKRLEQGREKGQTAVSQEVRSWAILLAAALGLLFMIPGLATHLAASGQLLLDQAHAHRLSVAWAETAFIDLLIDVTLALAPLLGVVFFAALAASWLQTGAIWAPSKLAPELSKISPIKGMGRLFSTRALVEFAKGIAKIIIVTAVGVLVSAPLLADMERLPSMAIGDALERVNQEAVLIVGGTLAVMTLVAITDYLYQRWAFLKQMRMTKQEVRDEHKQQEGDPQVKGRIRRLRAERAKRRMMAAVPEADVVVTNPTHYAVALAYNMADMAAPKCVAKGTDEMARRIRELAEVHDVPVVENPPLARALHAALDLDEEVPPEHYHAVAEVIGYVMRLKGKIH